MDMDAAATRHDVAEHGHGHWHEHVGHEHDHDIAHMHECDGAASSHGASASADDVAEYAHWRDVCNSLRDYSRWMAAEVSRREAHMAALRPELAALLPPSLLAPEAFALQRGAVLHNQRFLDFLVAVQEEDGLGAALRTSAGVAGDAAPHEPDKAAPQRSSAAHFSKVKSTLHSLARDWSAEGAKERDASYGPILQALATHCPARRGGRKPRVAVPGCGTGRLVYDLAKAGYSVQGCEFSYFMVFASHAILNSTAAAGAYTIFPWIHDASNHMRREDMLRPVKLPDVNPAALLDDVPDAEMSIGAAEFEALYRDPAQHGQWDAVATCFFIDTAPVVLDYICVIWDMLAPGGVWVNNGPLLYHWQNATAEDVDDADRVDDRYAKSLELCYADLRYAMIAKGFEILHETSVNSTYAANRLAMMKTMFTTVVFVARKPGPPAGGKPAVGSTSATGERASGGDEEEEEEEEGLSIQPRAAGSSGTRRGKKAHKSGKR